MRVFPNVIHKWSLLLFFMFIWTSGGQNWIHHNPWFVIQFHSDELFEYLFLIL